ncbi:MAG: EamA family transporter [Burkholderiaceae bacterium]|nr:EamA family transporter [Burkholderiaceae bacterium]
MPLSHAALALAVVAVWGTNFVVIRFALDALPPLALAVLRFALAFVPAAFFIARPRVPWRQLAAYGVLIGVGQFGLLYVAIRSDIAPGLASLVVQTQVFFTIGLAMALEGERPRAYQGVALALAVAGLGWIASHSAAAGATPLGLVLVLLAALSWSAGNLVSRRAGPEVDMLGYMVWSSAFAVPPLVVLSLVLEGPAAVWQGVVRADAGTWLAVVWQAAGNALFGYAGWAWLLSRHAAATITPWALGVPVFGMISAALVLGEPMPASKVAASVLVIAGLAINVFWPRWARSKRRVAA